MEKKKVLHFWFIVLSAAAVITLVMLTRGVYLDIQFSPEQANATDLRIFERKAAESLGKEVEVTTSSGLPSSYVQAAGTIPHALIRAGNYFEAMEYRGRIIKVISDQELKGVIIYVRFF